MFIHYSKSYPTQQCKQILYSKDGACIREHTLRLSCNEDIRLMKDVQTTGLSARADSRADHAPMHEGMYTNER
ncbi:hypothetical protein FKM82_025305 [Ascaphus truei]